MAPTSKKQAELIFDGSGIRLYEGENMMISLSNNLSREEISKIKHYTYSSQKFEIAEWGEKNQLPQKREEILRDNNIVPELINTKRMILIGQGLVFYKENLEDGKRNIELVEPPSEIAEFLDRSDWDNYILKSTGDLGMHANIFAEFIRTNDRKIDHINFQSCKRIRAGRQDKKTGLVKKFFWHGSWKDDPKAEKPFPIPAYDPQQNQAKFILHRGDPLFYDGYYFSPAYWGGKEWIELSNAIPKFHKANLKNGYSVRYHIEIPEDYFEQTGVYQSEDQQKEALEKEREAEREFITMMNKFLAGVENAGRAVYTKFNINAAINKQFPGIKITPLTVDLKDEALLKLFEKSNQANISAQGIHPTLAAIETQGKLSSGSEIRNALNQYIAIKTALPRKILLEPLELVKKINGWPKDIKFGFEDIQLEILADNDTGMSARLNDTINE